MRTIELVDAAVSIRTTSDQDSRILSVGLMAKTRVVTTVKMTTVVVQWILLDILTVETTTKVDFAVKEITDLIRGIMLTTICRVPRWIADEEARTIGGAAATGLTTDFLFLFYATPLFSSFYLGISFSRIVQLLGLFHVFEPF